MKSNAILWTIAPFALLSLVDGVLRGSFRASPGMFWTYDALKWVLLPASLLLWLRRVHYVTPEKYGLGKVAEHETWGHFLGFILFLTAILYVLFEGASTFAWLLFGRPEAISFYKEMAPDGIFRFPVVLYFALTAGLVEEIFFRGLPLLYLQERFRGSIPSGAYVMATASLFGLIHWENGAHQVFATFIYGVFAALFYLKLRDLWPLVAAHTLADVEAFW